MRDAFVEKLIDIAESDDRVVLVTGDLGFGVLTKFEERLPGQFLNAGVAEQNMTLLATGLALGGRTVFTYSIANFPLLRPLEMVRNDACYHDANVKVVGIGGGFSYGALGMSHHATEDLAIARSLPGMTVVSPCDISEAQAATEALARSPGTAYLRLDKSVAKNQSLEPFVLGKARLLRPGSDVTVIGTGGVLQEALDAADTLAVHGTDVRVMSMHTVKPIDREAIVRAAEETGGIVTIEEHGIEGGLGSAVAEVLMDEGVRPRGFKRIALRAGFSSIVGSQEFLRGRYGINAEAVICAVATICPTKVSR